MMTIADDIYTNLGNTATLYQQIGLRIYPDTLPDDVTLPALSYLSVSLIPEYPISGNVVYGWMEHFQFDIVAEDSDRRDVIRKELIAALLAFAGNTVTVYEKGILNSFNTYDPDATEHRATLDWQVLYA